jgi:SAM-dependent methyltransferase
VIWLYILLILISGFLYAVFFGAPYVPAFGRDLEELLDLSSVGKGTAFVDLGSGDGKVLLAAAKRGAQVTGYEINPLLWALSLWRLRSYRQHATVHLRSMWRANISDADVVYMYLHTRWMDKMERKVINEMPRGSRVVSYVFVFSQLKQIARTRNAQVYEL